MLMEYGTITQRSMTEIVGLKYIIDKLLEPPIALYLIVFSYYIRFV